METFSAFAGHELLASAGPFEVAAKAVEALANGAAKVLIFEDETGRQLELDYRASPPSLAGVSSGAAGSARARGRPKLGVTAREVTLLPRHWDWLATQPGGASATLRRLVEEASRASASADHARETREAVYRVMSALAGDLPLFEEASRALFANDDERFRQILSGWPTAISSYLTRLRDKSER